MIQCIIVPEVIEGRLRRWGNSLALLIPSTVARAEHLKAGDQVRAVVVKPRRPKPAAFGLLKDLNLDLQRMKDRIREEEDA